MKNLDQLLYFNSVPRTFFFIILSQLKNGNAYFET